MRSDPHRLLRRGALTSLLRAESVGHLLAQIREGGEPMMPVGEVKSATVAHRQRRVRKRTIFEKVLERAAVLTLFDIARSVRIDGVGNGRNPLLRSRRQLRTAAIALFWFSLDLGPP